MCWFRTSCLQVVVLMPEGHDFVLIDLVGCSVFLVGHMPALRMLGLRDTTVVAGPVTGACFVDGAAGCKIILASYQVMFENHAADTISKIPTPLTLLNLCLNAQHWLHGLSLKLPHDDPFRSESTALMIPTFT